MTILAFAGGVAAGYFGAHLISYAWSKFKGWKSKKAVAAVAPVVPPKA